MANGAEVAGWTGRLTAPPETRTDKKGNPWVSFRVAVGQRKLNRTSNEWEENTTFWNVKAFNRLGKHLSESRALVQGAEITFSGVIERETWEGKGGEAREGLSIILDRAAFEVSNATVDTVNKAQSNRAGAPAGASASAPSSITKGGTSEEESFFGGSGSTGSDDSDPFAAFN